ncbi:DNA-binding protein WhiA [Sesbania bispinosa]|nr:DNA-binding protein WhiA [Sesbania bispinosa]
MHGGKRFDKIIRRGGVPKSQTKAIANQCYMLVEHSHVLCCKESSELSRSSHYKEVLFGNGAKGRLRP